MTIMSCTGFLSMWMSNTSITVMMLPMVEAILMELIKENRSRNISNEAKIINKLISYSDDNRASEGIEKFFPEKSQNFIVFQKHSN